MWPPGRLPRTSDFIVTTQEGTASPLDMPQRFGQASSFEVRDKLQRLVEDDLLGPWDGEFEQVTPRAMGPRERYLVGMLGPRHQPRSTLDDADTASDTESGVQGDTRGEEGGELSEVLTTQNLGWLWASSMGLSFSVGAEVDVLSVTAAWGQYSRQETQDDEGRIRTAWAREPREFPLEVRLDRERDQRIPLTAADLRDPGVYLAVAVRPQGVRRTVELVLVNNQQEPPSNADTAWLFQAGLTVTALDGVAPVFLRVREHPTRVPGPRDQGVVRSRSPASGRGPQDHVRQAALRGHRRRLRRHDEHVRNDRHTVGD